MREGRWGWMAALLALALAGPASAVPQVMRVTSHPYDPDWPEVYWMLATKCSSCHRPGSERQDFTSYEALIAAGRAQDMPAVVPGRPEDSMIWMYVAWNAEAAVPSPLPDQPEMPPEKHEWLSRGQLETLRRWIQNGALQYKLPATCSPEPLTELSFPSARQCGGCHPRQYDQWSRSMHHYAQHSPVFEAFNLALVERTAGTIGTFCTRCHTPLGTILGENESVRNVNRSQLSMEGVTCVACHRRPDGQYKASGRIHVEPGKLLDTCIYGPFEDSASEAHHAHASQPQPYIKTSQFCGECHDVTNPEGVRLEEAFAEWQNSPAARQGITCQHCHMGPVQGRPIPEDHRPLGRAAEVPGVDPQLLPLRRLSDHTFAGPDYSLLPDTEFPHKLDWMYETDYRDMSRLTPYQRRTLDELRRLNRESLRIADQKRYELLTNAARIHVRHDPAVRPGSMLPVDVAVESLVAGHNLPTGFTAERQVWLSVTLCDPQGNVVFASGDFDKHGDLRDDHSHEIMIGQEVRDRYLFNLQSKFIALTNKGTERPVILSVNRHVLPLNVLRPAAGPSISFGRPPAFRVSKGSLPPLKTMHQRYPIRIPDGCGPYQLKVQLNFRHLPPALLDAVGTPHLKPLLEVVVIDQYQGLVWVGRESPHESTNVTRLPTIKVPQ